MLSVVGDLQIHRCDVSAVFVEAVAVEPVDPFGGGQLDLLDGPPRLAGFDQLGFVQPVDRLGQRVIVGAADGTDRRLDASFREPLSEPDRGVLRSFIGVKPNPA